MHADAGALSYDDGPGFYTPLILAGLRSRGDTKASFMVVGSRALEFPNTLASMYAAGHMIGAHTWSHRPLTTLTNGQIVAELVYTSLAIQQAIGVTPLFFRPPYGDIDDRVRAIIHACGLKVILWNRDTADTSAAANATVAALAWVAPAAPRIGSIVLQHDLFNYSYPQILPVVDLVRAAGIVPKRIDVCLNLDPASSYSTKSILQLASTTGAPGRSAALSAAPRLLALLVSLVLLVCQM